MALPLLNQYGDFNNAIAVTVVAAPASAIYRLIINVTIFNADTVAAIVNIFLKDGATAKQIDRKSLSANESWTPESLSKQVLDSTTKSITATLASSITTNQPTFSSSYQDQS